MVLSFCFTVFTCFKKYVTPEPSTIQDFMTPYDYNELIHSAKRKVKIMWNLWIISMK